MTKEFVIRDQQSFEACPSVAQPGCSIYFERDTFVVPDQWVIPDRAIVRGEGATIECSPDRATGNFVVGNDCFGSGGIRISDLTINGNFSRIKANIAADRRKLDGLVLFGDHNIAERVTVTDWGGDAESKNEAYGILLAGRKTFEGNITHPIIGSKVRDCIVRGGNGSYDNGIAAGPSGDVLIEGNTVFDVRPLAGGWHGSGIGCNGTATIRNNSTHGCNWGFYSEGAHAITLETNRFIDCRNRCVRVLQGSNDVTISGDRFELRDDATGGIFIEMDDENGFIYIGTKISNATFRLKSGATRFPVQGLKLPVASGRGEYVTGNTFDARINQHQLARDAVCLGNRTLNGAVIPALMDRKGKWGK